MLTLIKIKLALKGYSYVRREKTVIVAQNVKTGKYSLWYSIHSLCIFEDDLSELDIKLLLKTVLKEVYSVC